MAGSCPLPTPAQKLRLDIEARARTIMLEKVFSALAEAAADAAAGFREKGLDGPAPTAEYFASMIHQKMYCVICGADPDTLVGGRAATARAVIRNAENIARHYWGAEIPS